jgi:hypothetical protein
MEATVLGNFDVTERSITPDFTTTGMWYEFFTGDSVYVTDVSAPLTFKAGEYRLYTTQRLPKPVFTGINNDLQHGMGTGEVFVYPNPSAGTFTFTLNLTEPSLVQITVVNVLGAVVRKSSPGHFQPGKNNFTMDMGNDNDHELPPGIYFYRLEAGNFVTTGKLIRE